MDTALVGATSRSHPPLTSVEDLRGEHYIATLGRYHDLIKPGTYLEVGVFTGAALQLSRCASIAVDPEFRIEQMTAGGVFAGKPSIAFYQTTSDAFFASVDPRLILNAPIDFAFLDGMHHCEFLLRDFMNTERYSHPYSVIALHDCLPVEASIATRLPDIKPPSAGPRAGWWTGDVWRTALLLKRRRPDLRLSVLDAHATGLVMISNLDARSTVIRDNLDGFVAEMMSWRLEDMGLDALFDEFGVRSTGEFQTKPAIDAMLWG